MAICPNALTCASITGKKMGVPQFSRDVRELIALLEKYGVLYLLVGGSAVIYHGYARYTGDVDFYYRADPENAKNLYAALKEFWAGPIPHIDSSAEFLKPGQVIQFGVPPFRIDLLNRIDGVEFAEAYASAIDETIDHEKKQVGIKIISKQSLLKNKKASGRSKDLDDVEQLK